MNIFLKKVLASQLIAIVLVSLAWEPVRACINLYAQNLKGHQVHYGGNHILANLKAHDHDDKNQWEKKRNALKAEVELPGAKFESRADYASLGIYLGDVSHAIEQLEALEREKPGEGIIASNLGTAYELNGNTAKALEWIKEGVHRNPNDHNGTEWLHVKILEAKLELANDKGWLNSHSVLGMNFGTDAKPAIPSQGVTDFQGALKSLPEVEAALAYQLHERIYFVKPPDPVVADLLSDMACLIAASHSLPEAKSIMEFALEYKPVKADLSVRRLEFFTANSNVSGEHNFLWSLAIIVIVVIIGYWFVKRLMRAV